MGGKALAIGAQKLLLLVLAALVRQSAVLGQEEGRAAYQLEGRRIIDELVGKIDDPALRASFQSTPLVRTFPVEID